MAGRFIHRTLDAVLRRAASEFPAVVLTGPRQSGKTTLLKHVFFDRCGYVSLEPPDVRLAATQDPRGLLAMHPPPVIFDEVQYAPGLLPYIKERIDTDRDACGQYILTGSQNLLLMASVGESLAGRAAILKLLPLSRREAEGRPDAGLPWEAREALDVMDSSTGEKLWSGFLRGGFPEVAAQPKRDLHLWHASYVQTYLERDVRTLRQVGDLAGFQRFVLALAARSGQLLDMAGLARDLGIAPNTVKAWLSVMEATYQVVVVRPYFANIGKRLVKTPKVYFTDVGTLCHLVGLRDAGHAALGPMAGAILETAVLGEVVKAFLHRGIEPRVYFWRTSAGSEVDILVETEGRLVPLEVKLSSTPRPAMAAGIEGFRRDVGEVALPGYVVHPGQVRLPLGKGAMALPFGAL